MEAIFASGADEFICSMVSPSPRYLTVQAEQSYKRLEYDTPDGPSRLVVMVAIFPFNSRSKIVYLAFESVGIDIVVAEIALNEANAINTRIAFFTFTSVH